MSNQPIRQDVSGHAAETDALVIGSGFGGSAPALRLAQAGLRVQVVERGPLVGAADFRQTQDPNYVRTHIRSAGSDGVSLTYVEAYGGASPFYEMVSFRAPSVSFDAVDHDGRRLWPRGLTRAALDPWYELAERELGVRQLSPDRVPKTGQVFARIMQELGHGATRMPMAIGDCRGSGYCVTGCVYGAKRSLPDNYLMRAEEAGARVDVGWVARDIEPVGGPGSPRYLVTCVQPTDDSGDAWRTRRFLTRVVVVASGTVGTAGLLLRNRRNLPRMSRHVGRNVTFNASAKAVGLLPDRLPDVDNFTGVSMSGVVSYGLLGSSGTVVFPAKPMPLQMLAAARLRVKRARGMGDYWGPDNVELMRRYRRRALVLVGLGVAPPVAAIRCRPGARARRDEISVRPISAEAVQRYHHVQAGHERALRGILQEAGCTEVELEYINLDGSARDPLAIGNAHHVGSCRMADSADHGAVDLDGELFGHRGIHITDAAAIPGAPGVNPSLTILANAERISARMVERYARGDSR